MALKVVFMMTVVVVLSLATIPAPSAATRVDVAELLTAIDLPTGKMGDSSWCDTCTICHPSQPPICYCANVTVCSKCICYQSVPVELRPYCELLAPYFVKFCPSSRSILASLTKYKEKGNH